MKIQPHHWKNAYELANRVIAGELHPRDARAAMVERGISPGSAADFIYVLKDMRKGAVYTRALSTSCTDDFLTWILRDFGPGEHAKAVAALQLHLDYRTGQDSKTPSSQGSNPPASGFASLFAILAKHQALLTSQSGSFDSPEEVSCSAATHLEGKVRQVLVHTYERNLGARAKCIARHGSTCSVRAFSFGNVYGDIGDGFIHVHHLKGISSIGEEYEIDPIEDLWPVCPNCHAMLHTSRPALTIEARRQRMNAAN